MTHNLVITIAPSNGLQAQLVCDESDGAPCKASYGWCTLVHDFDTDPDAALEDYRGTETVTLLDKPVTVRPTSEFDFSWTFDIDTTERPTA